MVLNSITPASLPELYARWLGELLPGPIPAETQATCQTCVMLPPAPSPGQDQIAAAGQAEVYFNPATKCCTYVPTLHNYLVGQILLDDDPAFQAGRTSVEARLRGGIGVTPLGFAQPASYALHYEHGWLAFGRSRTMRCPHYLEEGGRCGVWKHRESTCCTWFCKYMRGAVGQAFWRESLHPLLLAIERQLALWCVLQSEMGSETLRALLAGWNPRAESESLKPEELDGRPDPADYRRVWGGWLGREAEFYEECARRADSLRWTQVLEIGGAEVQGLARLAVEAYGRLVDTSVPERLEAGQMQLVRIGPAISRVSSYSNEFDPLDLPTPLFDALRHFDGRPTSEALAEIRQREGITLEDDLVLKLADFAVLRPPREGGAARG